MQRSLNVIQSQEKNQSIQADPEIDRTDGISRQKF